MAGSSLRIVLLLVLLLAGEANAQPQNRRLPAFDPERIFTFGDTDLDDRLALEEYRELIRSSPRMKNAGATIEPLFRRLDTDHDGFLSLAEYSRSFRPAPRDGVVKSDQTPRAKEPRNATPAAASGLAASLTLEDEKFFESKIRPVLASQCGKCHASTAEKLRGGLQVDTREGLRRGGDSGPAIVPGQPEESLLIRAIRYRDKDLKMPPKTRLPDAVVADFEKWIKLGAPDPRTEVKGNAANHRPAAAVGTREFWSFRPPRKSVPPVVKQRAWPRGLIDGFLLAALESRGLIPVADASRATLLRRVTFDLIGLPPTLEEIDAFIRDDAPDAFTRVIDRLLAAPGFGERWGRHWLDVARFAESSGKTNFTYPQAWRYRDWVIASFNADRPYDEFVRQQVAGDLLPAGNDRDRADQLIATGFLAIGSKAHDAENRGQFILDVIDEQIEATTRAFLGLTVACARCHDHKMDPIPTARLLCPLRYLPQHCAPTRALCRASSRISMRRRSLSYRKARMSPRRRPRCPPPSARRWKNGLPPSFASAIRSRPARRIAIGCGGRTRSSRCSAIAWPSTVVTDPCVRSPWVLATETRPLTAHCMCEASSTSRRTSSLAGSWAFCAPRHPRRSPLAAAVASWLMLLSRRPIH